MIPEQQNEELRPVEAGRQGAVAPAAVPERKPHAAAPAHAWYFRLTWAAAGLILGLAAAALLSQLAKRPSSPPPLIRFALDLPREAPLAPGNEPLAISPDGTLLAYTAQLQAETQLYVRPLGKLEARPIPGTRGAYHPFFSPDGSWIGFFDRNDSKLKKVPVAGGNPVTLGQAPAGLGACWGADGSIVFAPDVFSGLLRISPAGGNPEPLTRLIGNESTHRWPLILPDCKTVIFTVGTAGAAGRMSLAALTLKSGQKKVLLEDASHAVFSPTGCLLFMRGGNLTGVAFDPVRLEVVGAPFVVKPGVETDPATGAGHFAFSGAGALAYVNGSEEADLRSLVWADRQGGMEKLTVNRGTFSYPRLSPDGRRVAIAVRAVDGTSNLWLLEVDTGKFTRVTFEGNNVLPVWSPDGTRLAFASDRNGRWNLYSLPADGSSAAETLKKSGDPQMPASWSADGRFLSYTEVDARTGPDIWILPMGGGGIARPWLQTQHAEWGGAFSPDGRWLAYTSDDTGPDQVYVRPFPGPGERFQISTAEGREPVWRHDGGELFFRYWRGLMSVRMPTEGDFRPDPPRLAVAGEYEAAEMPMFPDYDVSPDGQRFVLIPREGAGKRQVQIDWNCLDELKRPPAETRSTGVR